ncbi:hypothetical protein SUGI_0965770 [Cryptomeria japonica]|nr:hypothetical protein SUGI_0965770 [Cryptomeria japonica]
MPKIPIEIIQVLPPVIIKVGKTKRKSEDGGRASGSSRSLKAGEQQLNRRSDGGAPLGNLKLQRGATEVMLVLISGGTVTRLFGTIVISSEKLDLI